MLMWYILTLILVPTITNLIKDILSPFKYFISSATGALSLLMRFLLWFKTIEDWDEYDGNYKLYVQNVVHRGEDLMELLEA